MCVGVEAEQRDRDSADGVQSQVFKAPGVEQACEAGLWSWGAQVGASAVCQSDGLRPWWVVPVRQRDQAVSKDVAGIMMGSRGAWSCICMMGQAVLTGAGPAGRRQA